jgi:NADH:ubiquinone oxidoreductase subunit H
MADGAATAADLGDYSLLLFLAYAVLTTFFFFFIVSGTRSKYATIAGARLLVVTISFDVFSVVLWGIYCGHVGGYAFDDFYDANSFFSPTCALPPLALAIFLHALVEAKRAPFDHAEAESELVAGHLTEFGGRTLLFMYICEYIHVFFSIFLISVFVVGGPWGVSFLPYELFFDAALFLS